MELKLYMRRTQNYAIEQSYDGTIVLGDPIIYAGLNPANLNVVYGHVPESGIWKEYTNNIEGLDKLKLDFTTNINSQGLEDNTITSKKRSATNQLRFTGEAYQLLKSWLIDNVSAPNNSIDIKIEHVGCGTYDNFIIKPAQLQWCEGEVCVFNGSAQGKEEAYKCIEQTVINDNWQGWFQDQPANGKKHPRFVYCVEAKPSGMLIVMWWLMSLVFTILFLLTPIINSIMLIIGVIRTIIDAIRWLFGGDVDFDDNWNWFDPRDISNSYFLESMGCNRVHPAPLIRDYIDNVCKKCGIDVNPISSPIFHNPLMNIEASSGILENEFNPYYYATYLNAPAKKGIPLFRGTFSNRIDDFTFYRQENKPNLSLDMFLDKIKGIFNAEWRIVIVGNKPTLYFWRKDLFLSNNILYNFKGADREKIIQGMCFNWLDVKRPAFIKGLYIADGGDNVGNEGMSYMNDYISVADGTNNPTIEGEFDKTSQSISSTRFRLDGGSTDTLADAMQILMNGSLLNPTIPAIVSELIIPALAKYADYALLAQDDTAPNPKIIIWDENSGYIASKALISHAASSRTYISQPEPNSYYNSTNEWWEYAFPPETAVKGDWATIGTTARGYYEVKDYLGLVSIYKKPALLPNYPMFFKAGYKYNLWDYFHWIDDPRINPKLNKAWSVKICLSCEDLNKLGVFGESQNIKLSSKVIIDSGYYSEGTLKEIIINYDSSDTVGKHIELKGII